jgi:hypothetical protein
MSLDVSLISKRKVKRSGTGVFIRDAGGNRELTPAEVKANWPTAPAAALKQYETNEVFSANITHNLTTMADKAGLYMTLWRPEELNYLVGKDLIDPLRNGLARLKGNREHFEQYNPDNGWGSYEGLVEFVSQYLAACRKYPKATIEVSR